MGLGSVFTLCLGHLLLLHLERSEVHWQGKLASYHTPYTVLYFLFFIHNTIALEQNVILHELADLKKKEKKKRQQKLICSPFYHYCIVISAVNHNRVILIWFFVTAVLTKRTIACYVQSGCRQIQVVFFFFFFYEGLGGAKEVANACGCNLLFSV